MLNLRDENRSPVMTKSNIFFYRLEMVTDYLEGSPIVDPQI